MRDRQLMVLRLDDGETQRVLVEAGTDVLAVSGGVLVRGPLQWLAETVWAAEQKLVAEQHATLGDGGWIDLVGCGETQLVVIPPHKAGAWCSIRQFLTDFGRADVRRQA